MGLFNRVFGDGQPLNRPEFAKLLIRRLRQAGIPGNFSFDAKQFQIVSDAANNDVWALGNCYSEYCAAPAGEREGLIQNLIQSSIGRTKELPEDFEDAAHDLLPALRTSGHLEAGRLQSLLNQQPEIDLAFQRLNEHLVMALVYDLPATMRFINVDDLNKWGVGLFQAMEVARNNLEQRGTPFYGSIDGDLYTVSVGDSYDATRLLCLDLIRSMEVKGDHVAVVPNRNTLIVTGSENETGLAMMADLVEKALGDPRPMSSQLFRLAGDEWEPWLPDPGHPAYSRLKVQAIQGQMGAYEEQKEMLRQLFDQTGQDTFVASYLAFQRQDGDAFSYCAWTNGVSSLLPRTERIGFIRGDDSEAVFGDWNRVVAVMGDAMKPQGFHLERWHVTEFPTSEQLAAIGVEKVG